MSKKHYYGRAAAGLSFSEGVFSTTTASATGFSGRSALNSALTTYESDEREYEREYASAIAAGVPARRSSGRAGMAKATEAIQNARGKERAPMPTDDRR